MEEGTIKASIMDTDDAHAFDQIKALVLPKNKSMTVSTKNAYAAPNMGKTVAVLDLGLKHSMLRELSLRQANVTVLPYNAKPSDIENLRPDGIIISNGPGKPEELKNTLKPVFDYFYGKLPILGIGLGFLALSDYLEFELVKLPQEFDGINYPVIEQNSSQIWQTSMDIDQLILPESMQMNMNQEFFDLHTDLLAGFCNNKEKIIATAFNPEGAPGSLDANDIFDYFLEMME